jgi:acyl carrier protein
VSDTHRRLIRCFQAIFPELSESEAARASVSGVAAWDSVATVTLAAAMEEEFAIQFEVEEFENMTSFQDCLNLLAGRSRAR